MTWFVSSPVHQYPWYQQHWQSSSISYSWTNLNSCAFWVPKYRRKVFGGSCYIITQTIIIFVCLRDMSCWNYDNIVLSYQKLVISVRPLKHLRWNSNQNATSIHNSFYYCYGQNFSPHVQGKISWGRTPLSDFYIICVQYCYVHLNINEQVCLGHRYICIVMWRIRWKYEGHGINWKSNFCYVYVNKIHNSNPAPGCPHQCLG